MLAQAPCRSSSSACRGSRAELDPQETSIISAVWATAANVGLDDEEPTTTQLDSHANMAVAGGHATVFGKSGKHCDVRPFSSECSKLESVPIVDAAVAYD